MIDPKDVTFTTDNVHIPNSYRYCRKEVEDFVKDAKPKHPSCQPLQKRSKGSLLREWAAHKLGLPGGLQKRAHRVGRPQLPAALVG